MRKPNDGGHAGPHPACPHDRRMRQGHVRAMATDLTQRGKRRILRCHTWATPCAETRATVLCDLRPAAAKVRMARKRLLGRVAVTGSSLVRGVPEETVLVWLTRAASQAEASNRPLLRA